jgi:hypothetical protein
LFGHELGWEESRNLYKLQVLVAKVFEKRRLARPRIEWKDNIKAKKLTPWFLVHK